MLVVSPKHRIFLAVKPIDFRCGIAGISAICKNKYQQDPLSGHYFVFRNARKTSIKILYYHTQGKCLFQKRLSKGPYHYWPNTPTPAVTLTPEQLQVLLANGDPEKIITEAPFLPTRTTVG